VVSALEESESTLSNVSQDSSPRTTVFYVKASISGLAIAVTLSVFVLPALRHEVLIPLAYSLVVLSPIAVYVGLQRSLVGSILVGTILLVLLVWLQIFLRTSSSSTAGIWIIPYEGVALLIALVGGGVDIAVQKLRRDRKDAS
jgi:hypothetical protein